ncbi:DUF3450 domain-containing protein [Halomonas ramblicola]|uniref:DUF3450 domain-containing protein n=1 Tax=Halomonas ramblicola TaxID=747349 RepID=UPI0025B30CE4|nr:DUF3450 domain-containing protein [Halomonas ramblicola]MDN3522200.1 DUF3450 domain-containing protein [Halomonas ramblicola]
MERTRHILIGVAAGLVLAASPLSADEVLQEASEAQRAQAELQARIDAADDESREMLTELRRLEGETRRLEARAEAEEPRLERRVERLDEREAALDTLAETREVLPEIEQALVARLRAWIEQDLPFLEEERLARVEGLESGMADPDASAADRLDRILAAWRAELDYGRELDAWRGTLGEGDDRREVDFLRLGRAGLYYLTPDGREGGVWRADAERWQALDEAGRVELRHGLRIAREQRAPELLTLPISHSLERAATPTDDAEASL